MVEAADKQFERVFSLNGNVLTRFSRVSSMMDEVIREADTFFDRYRGRISEYFRPLLMCV